MVQFRALSLLLGVFYLFPVHETSSSLTKDVSKSLKLTTARRDIQDSNPLDRTKHSIRRTYTLLSFFPDQKASEPTALSSTSATAAPDITAPAATDSAALLDNDSEDDGQFNILTDLVHIPLLSEQEFQSTLVEINYFSIKVLMIAQAPRYRIKLSNLLQKWKGNPQNIYSVHWSKHFETISLMISYRADRVYIPNSLVLDYFNYIVNNIISANVGTPVFERIIKKSVDLINLMIAKESRSNIIDSFLNPIAIHISRNSFFSMLQSCHRLYYNNVRSISCLKNPAKTASFHKLYRLFFSILKHYEIDHRDFVKLKLSPNTISEMKQFMELLLFYRVFDLSQPNYASIVTPDTFQHIRSAQALSSCCEIINFMLIETEFNSNFRNNSPAIFARKRNIYLQLHRVLFEPQTLCFA